MASTFRVHRAIAIMALTGALLMAPLAESLRNNEDLVLQTEAESLGIDWKPITEACNEVDKDNDNDNFVVFETDGESAALLVKPDDPSTVSLATFRDALLTCAPRGKVCLGFYKFNYPASPGSSTMKGKSLVVKAVDKAGITQALGSNHKATAVTTPVSMFGWNQFKQALHKAHVGINVNWEAGDRDEITGIVDTKDMWDRVKRASTRVGSSEGESFIAHSNKLIQRTKGKSVGVAPAASPPAPTPSKVGPAPSKPPTAPDARPTSPSSPSPATGSLGGNVDLDQIRAIVREEVQSAKKEILAALGGSGNSAGAGSLAESQVKTIADREIKQAFGSLGQGVGDAIKKVGNSIN